MQGKIKAAGGQLRFDSYMQDHLYGEKGYYMARAQIGPTGHWDTDSSDRNLAKLIRAYQRSRISLGKHFVEVGGGTGIFKRHFLGFGFEGTYTSVDISPQFAHLQELVNGKPTWMGSVTSLPFDDIQINGLVFGNELIDALSCRVLKLRHNPPNLPQVIEEAFVQNGDFGPAFVFKSAQRDEFIEEYEMYLAEGNPQRLIKNDSLDGQVDSIPADLSAALSEINRVLRAGSRSLLLDYGYAENYISMRREVDERPYYKHWPMPPVAFEGEIGFPYQTDITYHVDFDYVSWLARQHHPNLGIEIGPLHHLVKALVFNDSELVIPKNSELLKPRNIGYIEISK